jgi:hypothetical protein
MYELCHIFIVSISYLNIMILPLILVMKQDHTIHFLRVYSWNNFL